MSIAKITSALALCAFFVGETSAVQVETEMGSLKKGDCCNLVDRSDKEKSWSKANVENLKSEFRSLVELSVRATYNLYEGELHLCDPPFDAPFNGVPNELCVTDIKGYPESSQELIDRLVGQTWMKYHPPLDENSEPDYSSPIDAFPVVNAMADVLTEQTAQLHYQRILVSVGPFSDEQKAKSDAAYSEFKEARNAFLEKTLTPMRFSKSIWQRSNVNKAGFTKMMEQLNGKAQDFKNLIPEIEAAGINTKKISTQTRNLVGLLFPILDSERLVQNAHDITRSAEVIYQTFLIEFAKLPEEKQNEKAMKKLKVKVRETIYEKGNNTNPSLRCLSIYAAKRANFKDFLELGTDVAGSQAISDSQLEVFKADTLSSAYADRIRGYQHMLKHTIREQIAEGEGNLVHEHGGEITAKHYYKKLI
jgi:hypothetical protein